MIRKIAQIYVLAVIFWIWGIAVGVYDVFPHTYVINFLNELEEFAKGHEETGPELEKELTAIYSKTPVSHLRKRSPDFENLGNGLETFPLEHREDYLGIATSDEGINAFVLYDNRNNAVHKWNLDYRRLFPSSEKTDERVNIHGVKLLNDGNLIVNFDAAGLVNLDWCGDVIWKFDDPVTHHLISFTDRGTIWVPGRTVLTEHLYGVPKDSFDDTLMEVSLETGDILRSISTIEILFKNSLHGVLEWIDSENDFTHVNDIEELGQELAAAFPQFSVGDLMVNAKRINMVFIVDPNTLKVKWHARHPWNQPHDPDFLPNGKIRLFDNNQDRKGKKGWGTSRILQVSPATGEVEILFDHPNFHSDTGSLVEGPLEDMLVTSSIQSTVFTVKNGKVDFMFWRPYDEKRNYYIKHAEWYPKTYLAKTGECN